MSYCNLIGSFLAIISILGVPAWAAPGDAEGNKPNILFIAVDDLNDWIGANGPAGHPQVKTPNLDRLVRRGVYFTNAHTAVPVCMASRLALMSGLSASTTGHYSNHPIAEDSPLRKATMLPAYLRSHGYRTLGGGKIYHHGTDNKTGCPDWDEVKPPYTVSREWLKKSHGYGGRVNAYFQPFPRGGSPIVRKYGEKTSGYSLCGGPLDRSDIPRGGIMPDEELADWAVAKLRQNHDRPFFLAVGFARPHVPYTAPRKYFEMYEAESLRVPQVAGDELSDVPLFGKAMAFGMLPRGDHWTVLDMGPDYWRDLVHAYLACVSFVDHEIGRVLEALRQSPYAQNTLIVLWSDHGQHLGEKKHWRKQCLWEEAARVPLVWALPEGRNAGRICTRPVSLLDVYPTLIELVELPPVATHEGESLVPLLNDPDGPRETPAISTWHFKNHSVRSRHWRYIRYRDGTEELYDHRTDPGEHTNLAQDPQYARVIAEHRRRLPRKDVSFSEDPTNDALGKRVRRWQEQGDSLPDWLK